METAWKLISGMLGGICVVVIAGYFGWLGLKRSEDPGRLIFRWCLTAGLIAAMLYVMQRCDPRFLPALAVVFGLPLSIIWAPSIGAMVASPLTSLFDGGMEEAEPMPLYSMAEAKRKSNLFPEAMAEVHKQLEKFPDDFTGVMLLAAIQAEDMNDLPGGTRTLENLLATGKVPAHSTVAALQTLADWHLKYAQDPVVARGFLQRIVDLYPDTPLAQQVEQRIARMDSVETVSQERVKYEVTPGVRNVGLRRDVKIEETETEPGVLAAQYVKQLERHPMDTDTREKLALLYAEKFQRLDLALDQLEQLISHPSETPAHIGRWLNLLATLHIKHANDIVGAEQALHRVIEKFPKSAVAHAATTRLAYLDQELKALDKTEAKRMGTYEGKLGLKKASQPAA